MLSGRLKYIIKNFSHKAYDVHVCGVMNNNFYNNFLDALDDCDVSDGLDYWTDDIHKVLD
jgi:hypothetical protein